MDLIRIIEKIYLYLENQKIRKETLSDQTDLTLIL